MKTADDYFTQLAPLQSILLNTIMYARYQQEPFNGYGIVLAIAVIGPNRGIADVSYASRCFGSPGLYVTNFAYHASEKIRRLHFRRMEGKKEIAASESADPKNRTPVLCTHGGCIVSKSKGGHEVYVSCSGQNPEMNEALAFGISEKLGLRTPRYKNQFIKNIRLLLNGAKHVCIDGMWFSLEEPS